MVDHPGVDVVVELIGGTGAAREIIEAAIASGKSVVTANKELMALAGAELWDRAIAARHQPCDGGECRRRHSDPCRPARRNFGRSDQHAVRNFERHLQLHPHGNRNARRVFRRCSSRSAARRVCRGRPSADVDGFDARSKLAILTALAFGEKIIPADIYTEGIRRITPVDFEYAHQLHHTIRLICAARQTTEGLILSVRPSLIPQSTILASVRGAYNAVWVSGQYGADTFYYGRGAGPHPTGVAVVSDLMRVAREIRSGSPERVSPFAHASLGEYKPIPITLSKSAYYLRFRVEDRPGIIAQLATALAAEGISIDAVLQLPKADWRDLPFVITVEPATEQSIRSAIARMLELNFLIEPPLAMPMELPL